MLKHESNISTDRLKLQKLMNRTIWNFKILYNVRVQKVNGIKFWEGPKGRDQIFKNIKFSTVLNAVC